MFVCLFACMDLGESTMVLHAVLRKNVVIVSTCEIILIIKQH
jgi:hypothetical protein